MGVRQAEWRWWCGAQLASAEPLHLAAACGAGGARLAAAADAAAAGCEGCCPWGLCCCCCCLQQAAAPCAGLSWPALVLAVAVPSSRPHFALSSGRAAHSPQLLLKTSSPRARSAAKAGAALSTTAAPAATAAAFKRGSTARVEATCADTFAAGFCASGESGNQQGPLWARGIAPPPGSWYNSEHQPGSLPFPLLTGPVAPLCCTTAPVGAAFTHLGLQRGGGGAHPNAAHSVGGHGSEARRAGEAWCCQVIPKELADSPLMRRSAIANHPKPRHPGLGMYQQPSFSSKNALPCARESKRPRA